MWAKLGQWAASAILLPVLKQFMTAIYKGWVARKAQREKEKENQERCKEYEKQNPVNSGDSFADLP